jgi:hypothetical protein
MSEKLEIIHRIADEHRAIGGHVKLVGDSITDEEARRALEKAHADWIPGLPQSLSEKRDNLERALSYLNEGLEKHFAFEESVFPSLVGELLMRAILIQHAAIRQAISEARSAVGAIRTVLPDRDEVLAQDMRIQRMVGELGRMVDEHASREETLLEMLRAALEEEPG